MKTERRFTRRVTIMWVFDFHSYSGTAATDLAHQLRLLQALASAPLGVSLSWRLSVREKEASVDASLELICSTDSESNTNERAKAAQELEHQASTALAMGYSFTREDQPKPLNLRVTRQLHPESPTQPLPVKQDWALLFDYLRRRGTPMAIELKASPAERGSHVVADAPHADYPLGFDFDPGIPFMESLRPPDLYKSLLLELRVHSDRVLPLPVLEYIGQTMLGLPVTPRLRKSMPVSYSPEMTIRAWHAPYGRYKGSGLRNRNERITSTHDLSKSAGVSLGKASVEGPAWSTQKEVRIGAETRLKHIYIVGKTGVGKTNLLKRIAEQDIQAGHGIAILTPHSDLIEHVVRACPDRIDDFIYLDFGDPEFIPVLNPLTIDVSNDLEFEQRASLVVDLLSKRTYHEWAGPVFADTVKSALLSVKALTSLDEFPYLLKAVELLNSDDIQRWAQARLRDDHPNLSQTWKRLFDSKNDRSDVIRWVGAKFEDINPLSSLGAATSQFDASPLSFRKIYGDSKVLLVHLPSTLMPNHSSEFVGRFIFSRLAAEAETMGLASSNPFYVMVDEFQRFVTEDIERLVAEARKFQLGLAIAHQNLRQLESFSMYEGSSHSRLVDAVLSNVGTMIVMKASGHDVNTFASELGIDESVIRSLTRGTSVMRTEFGGEDVLCTLATPLVEPASPSTPLPLLHLKERMIRDGYWQYRDYQHRQIHEHAERWRRAAGKFNDYAKPDKRSSGRGGQQKQSSVDDFMDGLRSKFERERTGSGNVGSP